MEAIFFDKQNRRSVQIIEQAVQQITIMVTDTEYTGKVTYKLSFYDSKKRPVYTELTRAEVATEFK